jgi:hypothetical protein
MACSAPRKAPPSIPCSQQASSIEWNVAIGQPTHPILKSMNTRIEAGQRFITWSTVMSGVGILFFMLPA